MSRFILATLALAATVAAVPASGARAQCRPGAAFCADLRVTGTVHVAPRPRVAQVVIRRPAQTRVVVVGQPAPPPAGRVIVVQPAPPPPPPPQRVIVVQAPEPPPPPEPEPTIVVVQAEPEPAVAPPPPAPAPAPTPAQPQLEPQERHRRFGLHAHVGGIFGRDVQMGGLTAALRFRPSPRIGLDFGLGYYSGRDYQGMDRQEVPLTVDTLFFLNPDRPFQVYMLVGMGTSWAEQTDPYGLGTRELTYFGGEAGIGFEWRIARAFALNLDFRAFLRGKVGGSDDLPEFTDPETGETTNVSTGGLGTIGATIYF